MNAIPRLCVSLALCLLAVGLTLPTPAAAEPADSLDELSEAQRAKLEGHVRKGKQAYDAGEFETSLTEFKRALEILEHPDFVYRLALTHDRLGHTKRALEQYRRFLDLAPETDDRGKVERTIAQLEEELRERRPEIEITTDPEGASVRLADEDRELGRTPMTATLQPGRYTIVLDKQGYAPVEQEVDLAHDGESSLSFKLTPTDPQRETATHSGSGPPTGAYLTLGGGAATGIFTLVSYLQFADARSTVRSQRACTPECTKPAGFDANARRQKTWEAVTWTSGAVATAALAGGAVWLAAGSGADTPSSRRARLALVPSLSADRIGLQLRLSGP